MNTYYIALLRFPVILAAFLTFFALLTWVERKLLGRIQNRRGPNRVGPVGLFQPIADAVKLLIKEDITPRQADPLVHFLAPVVAVIPPMLVLAVLPLANDFVPVDLNIGVLFAFAVSTASVLALFMAGWGSHNKFSLLGAMRAVAQVISYEVPMVLAALVVVMAAGTLSTVEIVEAQRGWFGWFLFRPWGMVGFALFVTGVLAEAGRTPFDIPEAESEIIAGYHTEYSGFKFALFQMGEYLAALAMSGIAITLFLGGYLGPWSGQGLWGTLVSVAWFFVKLAGMSLLIIWIRGTWPRFRVDQLLGFAWKLLLPMALVNILAVALWHCLGRGLWGWLASAVLLAAAWAGLLRLNFRHTAEKREYRYI